MADESPMQLRHAELGDPEFAEVIGYIEHIRQALAPLTCPDDEMANQQVKMMTALVTFAGTIFGTLIVAGIAKDQDKRRATDSMMKNFRTGIDIGKRRGLRVEQELFGGTIQ